MPGARRVLILHGDGRVQGGPLAFVRLTLTRLDPAKLAVQVISLGSGRGADELQRLGVAVEVWPASRVRNVGWTWRTMRRLLAHVRHHQVDLIISNNAKEHLLGGMVAALARIPCAWVSHNMWRDGVRYARLVRLIPAQAVIANSQATRRALPAALQQRVRLIPFGPEPARLDAATRERAAALRAQWGHPTAALTCLGVLAPEKGQHWLLEAAPDLVRTYPDLRIVLVGDDPRAASPVGAAGSTGAAASPYRDRLHSLVRDRGLERNVVFYGYTDDIYPPLLAADVVVHTSLVPETFGFALIEAMQAGRPVVAADLGAQAELIKPGVTGVLVPAGDAAGLVGSIENLLSDPALARRLAGAALEHVAGRYTADRMAAAMQALMLELIGRGRR